MESKERERESEKGKKTFIAFCSVNKMLLFPVQKMLKQEKFDQVYDLFKLFHKTQVGTQKLRYTGYH